MMWGNNPLCYGTWGNGNSWWMGLVMMAVQLIFWGLLIWFGVSFFKRTVNIHTKDGRYQALGLLKERYARGEIDTEEFRQRKEGLQNK